MKRYWFFLLVFCLLYFLLMNVFNNFELGHDQARHANGGLLWYYYFHGYGERTFASFDEFLSSFPQFSRGKIAWYFLYDPPLQHILIAFSYTFFGITEFAARFPSQVLAIMGIIYVFLLAKKMVEERIALLLAILYGFVPFVFSIGRDAMTDVSAASCTIAWMYYTFFIAKEKQGWRKYAYGMIGGIFLSAGVLIKYPTLFFFLGFFGVYFFYTGIKNYRKENKMFPKEKSEVFFIGGMQLLMVLLLSSWWVSYSLFGGGISEILFSVGREGWTEHGFLYNMTYLSYELLIETAGFFVGFYLLVFYLIFKRISLEDKEVPLFIYSCFSLFLAPAFFTNIQPRYYLAVLPFVFILIARFLEHQWKKWATTIFIGYASLFFFISITMAFLVFHANGVVDASGFDEVLNDKKGPALFFNYYGNFDTIDIVSGPNILTVKSWWQYWYAYFFRDQYLFNVELDQQNHYYNPDLFMFRMLQHLEENPEIGFVYLSSAELEGIYGQDVLQIMNSTKETMPTYFVLANTKKEEEYQMMQQFLSALKTEKEEYTYWDFYRMR